MTRRRVWMGAVAATAILAIGAPQADATGTVLPTNTYDVSVSGSQQAVGCTYTLTVNNAPPSSSAYLTDNGQPISGSSGSAFLGSLHVHWTPTTAGTHTISGYLSWLDASLQVNPLTVQVSNSPGGFCGLASLSSGIPGS